MHASMASACTSGTFYVMQVAMETTISGCLCLILLTWCSRNTQEEGEEEGKDHPTGGGKRSWEEKKKQFGEEGGKLKE